MRIRVWECGRDFLLDSHWQNRLIHKEFQCAFEANSVWTRLLSSSEPSILCQWFSKYAAETKTTAGKSYHPSIHLLFTSYLLVAVAHA